MPRRLVRVLACSIGACLVLWCAAPEVATAQRSHHQRQQRQRRLAEDRARAGDRFEAEEARARYCAEVGEEVCREHERRAQGELWRQFIRPSLGYLGLGALAIGGFLWWTTRNRRRRVMRSLYPSPSQTTSTATTSLDVVVIDLALEPSAAESVRAQIEEALARRHTLEATLADAARALLLARAAWTHAAVRSWPLAAATAAEERYAVVVREAHARAAMDEGALRDTGPGYRGGPADASALRPVVLLSLAVLSRDELPEQGGAPPDAASGALAALALLRPDRVQRVDLTWLPTARGDALSAAELVARHPRLIPIVR